MATYIQSQTGAQLTDDQIKNGSFPAGTFFIQLGGNGQQLTQSQITGSTAPATTTSVTSIPYQQGQNSPGQLQLTGYSVPSGTQVVYNGQLYNVQSNGSTTTLTPLQAPPGNLSSYGFPDLSQFAPSTQTTQTSSTSTTPSTTSSSTSGTLTYNPAWAAYGVTQDSWSQLNTTQQAVVGAALTSAANQYSTGASKVSLSDALAAAATDPNLVAQYADAAKIDANTFQQTIQQLQQASTLSGQQQQQQFENDRKALSEQQAANGTAYSGFRGQAQQQLGQTEAGIVQSSRSTLQNNLDQATKSFEQKYGTAATTPATASFNDPYASSNYSLSGLYKPSGGPANTLLTGTTTGGITGSQPIAKQNSINDLAGQYVSAGEIPAITSV